MTCQRLWEEEGGVRADVMKALYLSSYEKVKILRLRMRTLNTGRRFSGEAESGE